MKNKFTQFLVLTITFGFVTSSLAQHAEPELLKDINPGPNGSWAKDFGEYNGKLYFIDDSQKLYVSDGTEAGTEVLKDFNSGIEFTYVDERIVYNGKLYFSADVGVHGNELCVTDGTASGTTIFKDINPGSNSYVKYFKEYNGKLYFSANGGASGRELWVTDGTEAGTQLLKDINPGSGDGAPSNFVESDGKLFFSADNGIHGRELWVTDGTVAGTFMVKNINPGASSSMSAWIYAKSFNDKLYFLADNGVQGNELWVSDGTATGTFMLKDINPGSGSSFPSNKMHTFGFNGLLYFRANDGTHGEELWVTDGTQTGTSLFKDINPGPDGSFPFEFYEYNGNMYFNAITNTYGREIWVSDGTEAGTVLFMDINPGAANSGYFFQFFEYNSKLFFNANDGVHGGELWVSDGSPSGTYMLSDINPGSEGGEIYCFTIANGHLYFYYLTPSPNFTFNLWVTNGTQSGTEMITVSGTTETAPLVDLPPFVFEDNLYFLANYDTSYGLEPYKLTTQPLSIDTPQSTNFAFYPNPTASQLFITADVPVEKAMVYNLQGQLLVSQSFQHTPHQPTAIDFFGMQAGVYFVKLIGNGWEETHKIIKK